MVLYLRLSLKMKIIFIKARSMTREVPKKLIIIMLKMLCIILITNRISKYSFLDDMLYRFLKYFIPSVKEK